MHGEHASPQEARSDSAPQLHDADRQQATGIKRGAYFLAFAKSKRKRKFKYEVNSFEYLGEERDCRGL